MLSLRTGYSVIRIIVQIVDEMTDAHEQEKMELSQTLIQQGRHDAVEECLKALQKRQQEQLDNRQAELDGELLASEAKVQQMINGEQTSLVSNTHRDVLEEVRWWLLTVVMTIFFILIHNNFILYQFLHIVLCGFVNVCLFRF